MMRLFGLLLLVPGLCFCSWASASAQVDVHIITPSVDHAQVEVSAWRGSLATQVRVWVGSVEPITTVVANAGAESAELTAEENSPGTYYGDVDLTGLSDGEVLLSVTATNEGGATGSASRPILFDYEPEITIISPRPGNVIGHSVLVRATCRDNSPQGCAAMRLNGDEPWTAGSSFERLLDLSAFAGQCVRLGAYARDARNNAAFSEVEVCVESSPWLRESISSDGTPILAFDGEHAIFRSCDGARLLMRDRAGVTAQISDDPRATPIHLWNGRAVLLGWQNSPWGPVSVWHGGVTTVLADRVQGATAGSQWLALRDLEGRLAVRDLGAASEPWSMRIVASLEAPVSVTSIAENGTLLLLEAYATARLVSPQGTLASLDAPPEQRIRYLSSDGTRLLVVSTDGYDSDGNELLATRLVTGTGPAETLPVRLDFSPLLHNGWIAYDVKSGTRFDLRVRAVDGTERLIGTFTDRSVPLALSDAGELMYSNRGRLYRSVPGAAPQEICQEGGRVEWRDGWYVTMNQTVYRILVAPEPIQTRHVFEACAPAGGATDAGAGDAGADAAGADAGPALGDAAAPGDADANSLGSGDDELHGGGADTDVGADRSDPPSEDETAGPEETTEDDARAADSSSGSYRPESEQVSEGAQAADAAADASSARRGEGGGCSIGTSPRNAPTAALGLALAGLLVQRRRRSGVAAGVSGRPGGRQIRCTQHRQR